MNTRVVVNDRMQRGYVYYRTEPVGPALRARLRARADAGADAAARRVRRQVHDRLPARVSGELVRAARSCAPSATIRALNYFGVNASQPLSVWRRNNWLRPQDPRGWFQWYCRYYMGRRGPDDARQIARWRAIARHVGAIRKHCEPGDRECRPRQRQALLHWAYDSRKL